MTARESRGILCLVLTSIFATYALTMLAAWAIPDSKDMVEKLAHLVLGGLLVLLRMPSTNPAKETDK